MADDAPAGVPEWVVTYGDMMSLLLTFFIMLVSLSEVKGDKKYQAICEALMQYMGYVGTTQAPEGEGFPLSGLVENLSTLGGHTNDDRGAGGTKFAGPQGTEVRVFRGREGTAIRVSGPLTFAPGSDEIAPEVRETLLAVAQKLAGKPNKIEIRGHVGAAALPAGCKFADKFVLSYERAKRVAELLQAHGIQRDRIRLGAAGDAEPLPASPDRQAQNADRVELQVLDVYAREFVGSREASD